MFGLFRLLISAKYWRTLFHGETWRQTGVSLRRLHKDARARKQLLGVAVLLSAPFLLLLYVGWMVGSGAILALPVVAAVGGGIAIFRNRKPVEDDGPLTLQLSGNPPQLELPPEPSPDLRREFAELALLHAVLADRAGSESFVQTKVLPEGIEVITRRRHLDILRERGLYERVGRTELDLLLRPDGHWAEETIRDVSMLLEPLRLLRWVLRVDSFLPTVGATMVADYKLAANLVRDPQTVFCGQELIEIANLRIAIEAAEAYFYRCWAEGSKRGLYDVEDADRKNGLKEYADNLDGNEAEDLLLGTCIVSRADDRAVCLATTLALRRAQVLRWVQGRMYGEILAADRLEVFLGN